MSANSNIISVTRESTIVHPIVVQFIGRLGAQASGSVEYYVPNERRNALGFVCHETTISTSGLDRASPSNTAILLISPQDAIKKLQQGDVYTISYPQESKKWCHMTPRKIKIWVDAIILARQEDRTDVDLWTPPKLPAFKTFLNGQLPPGYLEFPDNPPPVGFMAAAPAPLPQQPIPSATPAQLHNDRIYQHKYSGDMEDFLNYAEFPESDHTLRTRLSNAHYTRWSELKPSDDMNSQELKVIGIARGDANHLLASAVWYKEFLLAKLAKIDAQQL
ncbi:uncharacterized protein MELLADRAFT_108386 [Melampsora larici-populina 98AG31]|uniref:Uncharacterized protein n=1 Tax=Melampsora larici-populina (strain 98AG31 / pathotype 3-4-7) TaxID=747676 RepID=F4RSY1_MELLP|nr:uncharacterized protein MELLADRAFT_108386 [Melampsora larici-populina 98AG31]EGG04524.1 hypothetical protein MELLADRAFT_108386 [Melampsora larici-populina 98AG31]